MTGIAYISVGNAGPQSSSSPVHKAAGHRRSAFFRDTALRQYRLATARCVLLQDSDPSPHKPGRFVRAAPAPGQDVPAHLALHRWFRQKWRPVPAIFVLDQPSQAHYRPDRDTDEGSIEALPDKAAVHQLTALVARREELAPDLQIILMGRADPKEPWLEDTAVEPWQRGNKLIPESWRRD